MISPSTILRLYFVAFLLLVLFNVNVDAEGSVVGSVYELDTEYSGDNFFDGFDFFTVSLTIAVFWLYMGSIRREKAPVDIVLQDYQFAKVLTTALSSVIQLMDLSSKYTSMLGMI